MSKRKITPNIAALTDTTTIKVRFSDVDFMQIVWHGQYIKYFEDGRESFGKHYGISYMDVYKNGFMTPIVSLDCQYKRPLSVEDEAIIETRFINTDAAKVLFEYTIYKADDNSVVATGSSTQVFLNTNRELELVNPQFYLDWKKKWGIS